MTEVGAEEPADELAGRECHRPGELAHRAASIAAPGSADHQQCEDGEGDPNGHGEGGDVGGHQDSPSTLRMDGSRASMLSANLNCTSARRRLCPG